MEVKKFAVKSRADFADLLNSDLQDFFIFSCQGTYFILGNQKLDIFHVNVGWPSVVNIYKDKNKTEEKFYCSGFSISRTFISFV